MPPLLTAESIADPAISVEAAVSAATVGIAGDTPAATGSSLRSLRPGAQDFRDAPRLRDATTGNMRLSRVENFADCADPSFAQMFRETLQEFTRGGSIMRMNLQPCIDKRSDQPCPDRTLMVGAVARTQIA